jgi:single-stranded DNA-binding protein
MNRWTGTGHVTPDPELRATGGGTDICLMRIAVSGPPGTVATASST